MLWFSYAVFRYLSQTRASDWAKITFFINVLRGRALQWAQDVLASNEKYSLWTFWKNLGMCLTSADMAVHKIFNLFQGSRSVADFAVGYCILAEETG